MIKQLYCLRLRGKKSPEFLHHSGMLLTQAIRRRGKVALNWPAVAPVRCRDWFGLGDVGSSGKLASDYVEAFADGACCGGRGELD